MTKVQAIQMQQFGVQFYQASLDAGAIDQLVRFEVLSHGDAATPARAGRRRSKAKVNWDLLERRIASSERAYQRQMIRRKIDELVQYYEQCRQAHDLPSIPGAVIISCDEPLTFRSVESGSPLGRLQVPEREGILRAIDGQHRLLALHANIDNMRESYFSVPAIIFDRLPEDHVVQMFVTINAKHTRLNPSHLVALSGRQLYRDDALAAGHDVVRALNDHQDSPLHGDIKLLGVGRGRVSQAPLAQELKRVFASDRLGSARQAAAFRDDSRRFFLNYFKQVAFVFGTAWVGRKYSIRTAAALRAFIRVTPDVVQKLDQRHEDRSDARAIRRVIAPWGWRIGDQRFETDGAWKQAGTTVDSLAKDLHLALEYPEGAG